MANRHHHRHLAALELGELLDLGQFLEIGLHALEQLGAQLLVRVQTRAIFPNCPRYIVTPGAGEPSTYAPRPDYQPPEPAWKGFDDFKDYIHPRQPTPNGK